MRRSDKAASDASETSARDWAADSERYIGALSEEGLAKLAGELSVTADSLRALDAGWDGEAYTFPEKNMHSGVAGPARGRSEYTIIRCRR